VKKEAGELMNICLYCGSQNFLPEDEDSWINSSFQQENTGRKPLIQVIGQTHITDHFEKCDKK
jgi:hypothetical protein